MLGHNGGASNVAGEIPNDRRQEHIHKVVYWSNKTQGDADVSFAARDAGCSYGS